MTAAMNWEAPVRDFPDHEHHVKTVFNANFLRRLRNPRTSVFFGKAAFIDAHTVSAEPLAGLLGNHVDRTRRLILRGKRILIATGSSPVRPSLFPFGEPGVYDSDSILEMTRIPRA